MQWQQVVAITIGAFVALVPVTLIWYMNAGGIYRAIMHRKKVKLLEKTIPNTTCATNTDCPSGFFCFEGRCVPQKNL